MKPGFERTTLDHQDFSKEHFFNLLGSKNFGYLDITWSWVFGVLTLNICEFMHLDLHLFLRSELSTWLKLVNILSVLHCFTCIVFFIKDLIVLYFVCYWLVMFWVKGFFTKTVPLGKRAMWPQECIDFVQFMCSCVWQLLSLAKNILHTSHWYDQCECFPACWFVHIYIFVSFFYCSF